jgi:3D (Asp-Asp-Asp) domain-containing protein
VEAAVVIQEPVNVIEGYEYTEMIEMEATAYTLAPECVPTRPGDPGYGLTASGMKAQVGVVAVDTDYIPFGTAMYIEGYGYAIAGDTGGAIDGYSVDLFFNTLEECYEFGRQDVVVYILKQE